MNDSNITNEPDKLLSIIDEMKPKMQDVWRGTYREIGYKVSLHGKGEEHTLAGEGTWCFYIYLVEKNMVNFPAIWLEDKIYKWKPEAYGYISHDYYCEPLNSLEFHGGITFYQKHGHTEGYRYVELGCDYNHLWDQERGFGYNIEEVLLDVKICIDSVYVAGLIKEKQLELA